MNTTLGVGASRAQSSTSAAYLASANRLAALAQPWPRLRGQIPRRVFMGRRDLRPAVTVEGRGMANDDRLGEER